MREGKETQYYIAVQVIALHKNTGREKEADGRERK